LPKISIVRQKFDSSLEVQFVLYFYCISGLIFHLDTRHFLHFVLFLCITVVTPGLLLFSFQKIVTVREILLILVALWDHFIFFCSLANYCDTFAVFLLVLNYFWQQKCIFVITVCRCSLFSGLSMTEKIYIYNL